MNLIPKAQTTIKAVRTRLEHLKNNVLKILWNFTHGKTGTQHLVISSSLCWNNQSERYWEQKLVCSLNLYCLWETTTPFRIRHGRQHSEISDSSIHGQKWFHGQTSAIPMAHIFRPYNDPNQERKFSPFLVSTEPCDCTGRIIFYVHVQRI